jgi:hypothetical protein
MTETRQTTLREWSAGAFRPASALGDSPLSICNTETPDHE